MGARIHPVMEFRARVWYVLVRTIQNIFFNSVIFKYEMSGGELTAGDPKSHYFFAV